MYILHHHLETIEASSFWNLDFSSEALGKVLKNNSIRGSEEGKYILDEVLLIFFEILPIFSVLTKIDFIDSPEACHLIFVHLPDIMIHDGKNDKSIWILLE